MINSACVRTGVNVHVFSAVVTSDTIVKSFMVCFKRSITPSVTADDDSSETIFSPLLLLLFSIPVTVLLILIFIFIFSPVPLLVLFSPPVPPVASFNCILRLSISNDILATSALNCIICKSFCACVLARSSIISWAASNCLHLIALSLFTNSN